MSGHRPKPVTPPAEILAAREFEGHVRRITFGNEENGFKIVSFQVGTVHFKAAGNLLGVQPGDSLRIKGAWKEHPTYGWTFQVEDFLTLQPTTEEGILAYLGSGLLKGIRKGLARRIVDRFGAETLEVLERAPERLSEVPGISTTMARKLAERWDAQRTTRDVLLFLKGVGLSNALAARLVRHYGDSAMAVLKTNPFRVGMEVAQVGFATADAIAQKMGIARDAPDRLMAGLVQVLSDSSAEGHTHLLREDVVGRASALLGVDVAAVEGALEAVVAKGFVVRATVAGEDGCYFMKSLHANESELAALLLELDRQARRLLPGDVEGAIAAFEQRYRFHLAAQQQEALRAVAGGGVCVITGGPGTGKTTLVRALLHLVKTAGSDISFALCSPTGRAAQRLSETTGEEAATVHRLLRWNAQTGRFTHGPDNLLPVQLLIVDEASMLDVPLAWSLVRAIAPGTTVVFVGDVDQLPSVGPGAFLKDLIASGRAKTTRLAVIFRQAQASLIIRNSHQINAGHGLIEGEDPATSDFFFVEREDSEELRRALTTLVTERIPRRLAAPPADAVQVLTPMRRGPLGTGELNLLLQASLNPSGEPVPGTATFRIGDKVIQTSNNYDKDVYNGDVGRVLSADREELTMRVGFGNRVVEYGQEDYDQLELAYAITIHKSQGSEYPAVVVVLHTSHFIMLRRNLLYTAVTRGKRLVMVLGARKALYKAIRTSSESDRRTALAHWMVRSEERGDLLG